MRKEFESMLIIIVCGVLGVISAIILNQLYLNGIIIDELVTGSITIDNLMFLTFFSWIIIGVIIGVFKK